MLWGKWGALAVPHAGQHPVDPSAGWHLKRGRALPASHLDVPVCIEKDVLQLQVPVNDPVLHEGRERRAQFTACLRKGKSGSTGRSLPFTGTAARKHDTVTALGAVNNPECIDEDGL